jgi:hypothetical protein
MWFGSASSFGLVEAWLLWLYLLALFRRGSRLGSTLAPLVSSNPFGLF